MNNIEKFIFYKCHSKKKYELLFYTTILIICALTIFEVDSNFWYLFFKVDTTSPLRVAFLEKHIQIILKTVIVLTAIFSILPQTRFWSLLLLTLTYGVWSGCMFHIHADLFQAEWNPHGFIVTFLIIISIAEIMSRFRLIEENNSKSWAVGTVQLYIITLYPLAAIAKILSLTNADGFSEKSLSEYILLIGPDLAKPFTEMPSLIFAILTLTILIQLGLPLLYYLNKKIAFALVLGFHISSWLTLGLSFWFLIAFFPIVFWEHDSFIILDKFKIKKVRECLLQTKSN